MGLGQLMGSIPSNSISLILLYYPQRTPSEVSESQPSLPLSGLEDTIPECRELCTSLRKIGQSFCDHHPGLKTRVQISPQLFDTKDMEACNMGDVDIQFLRGELENVAGSWVTSELITE